ncbi:MAG TPA: glycosyl hydrolase, partial [Candidatus Hydrogenedentes bacterium]|nr:glycosyl hydrolase [Candidatus Hydrogenedentota bacterium]
QTLEGHPEWEARGLLIAQMETAGGPVSLDCPPGALFHAAAYPVTGGALELPGAVDLSARIQDGKLSWEPPAGAWRVLVLTEDRLYEGTHAAVSLCDKLPYINLLMPEPTARFLEVTHDAYAARLGKDLGKWFVSTFTDEPSLMSLFMRKQPWSVLPWSPNLPAAFEKRNGYPVASVLPHLAWGAGPAAEKARHDFWGTVGDLVSEHYFGQIQAWCDRHDVLSGGHLLCEESVLAHPPLYGDFFQCLRRLHAPSMDCLTSIPSEVPWQVARLVSSAADLEGRAVTMSEASDHSQRWRAEGDTRPVYAVTEDEIRGSLNRQMVAGITTITSYYSFKDFPDDALVRLNEWTGRCCTALKGGRQVTDIAVVYPADTLKAHYTPSREWTRDLPAGVQRIQKVYNEASQGLFAAGRDFTYVDGPALAEAHVRRGALRVNGLAWRVVVLPAVDTLPLKAWENLYDLWRAGGGVVALGALPVNSDKGFPCDRTGEIRDALFGDGASGEVRTNRKGGFALHLAAGQEGLLVRALDGVLSPDLAMPAGAPLRMTHRRIDGQEVYFLINDGPEAWSGAVSLCAEGGGMRWDPATGQGAEESDAKNIPLSLGPYGGMLLTFPRAAKPEWRNPQDGGLPGMTVTALPPAAAVVIGGEHVRGDVHPLADGGPWAVMADVTKSNVDVFQFLCFSWQADVDLSGAECLVFDTEVPGQTCTTALLVVLRDARGVETLAETGVPLGVAGRTRVHVPLSAFQRAGWSGGPAGPADFAQTRDIRIGWGGYLGTEGE